MKQRNPITTLLLSLFVPFYVYYWWYDTAKMMRQRGVNEVPNFAPLVIAIVVYMAAVIGVITSSIASVIHTEPGAEIHIPPIFGLLYLFMLALWIVQAIYCYRFSKAANTLVNIGISPGLTTAIFIFIAPVAIYLIQEKLNALPTQPSN